MGKDQKKDKKKHKEKDRKRRRRESESEASSGSEADKADEEQRKRRRAEKLAKKVARHLKKHSNVQATGYTDEDNPFGDANLTERFVWGKKIEKQLVEGADVSELTAKAEAKRHDERMEEIEKVKRRREQREVEREQMAEELELIQRERALVEAVELERKEEEFHLEQARTRAQHRLSEGRPKAIDLMAAGLFGLEGAEGEEEELEPYTMLSGLSLRELGELREDVDVYEELDKLDAVHRDFWGALATVVAHELAEATKQEEMDRARMRGEPPPAKYQVREAGWHDSIDTDVQVMLAGKTHAQLCELEEGIQDQLDSGEAADPEYWGAVLRRLAIHKAKARLREIYTDCMQQRLARQIAEVDVGQAMGWEGEEGAAAGEQDGEGAAPAAAAAAGGAPPLDAAEIRLAAEGEEEGLDPELAALAAADIRAPGAGADGGEGGAGGGLAAGGTTKDRLLAAARGEPRAWYDLSDGEQDDVGAREDAGLYSPEPLAPTAYAGREVVPEEEDAKLVDLLRQQVRLRESRKYSAAVAASAAAQTTKGGDADRIFRSIMQHPGEATRMLGGARTTTRYLTAPDSAAQPEDAAFLATASRMMGDLGTSGDAPFGGEVGVDSQVYWWHEKYRPRKPKYFNRVHTGYEWNKYNQTHYDGDNPPPKTVQGYKFNIFYPDLIEKTKAPTYKVDRDPTSLDGATCILRFTAGPPYEDIAFRIINKDWEYNHKRGFKCVFERGILHLYFNFQRQRYRR